MTRFFFYALATYIMYKIELPFEYSNSFELLIGILVTNFMLNLIDWIFYKLAYSLTGNYAFITGASSKEKGIIHWKIRCTFAILLCLFTYLPICSMITTFITHQVYLWGVDQYSNILEAITSNLPH